MVARLIHLNYSLLGARLSKLKACAQKCYKEDSSNLIGNKGDHKIAPALLLCWLLNIMHFCNISGLVIFAKNTLQRNTWRRNFENITKMKTSLLFLLQFTSCVQNIECLKLRENIPQYCGTKLILYEILGWRVYNPPATQAA